MSTGDTPGTSATAGGPDAPGDTDVQGSRGAPGGWQVLHARWGYCPTCERWRVSATWEVGGAPARCPACGTAPDPLERVAGAVGTTVLRLGG